MNDHLGSRAMGKQRPSLRSLYISYMALSDPLVETQVVAYLEGLSDRGHEIHLLTFETERTTSTERRGIAGRLAARGITWHSLRYHKRPSLPVTVFDTLRGALEAARLVRKHRLDVIHARHHVPAAMALIARRLAGCGLIFDIRGVMAEEYVDAGRWRRGGLAWRLTKRVERRAIAESDACVVLTPAARELLFGERADKRVSVIPSCANLDRLIAGRDERDAMRLALRLEGKTVMVYIGKFGGWYLQRQMVEFFATAAEEIERLHFLVLTQDDPRTIEDCFQALGVASAPHTVTAVPPERIGAALAAADFGISFIAPLPSKIASSPTKIGEYLGAGLPIVAMAGIGGVDGLLSNSHTGVMVSELTPRAYREAARQVKGLLEDPETSARCIDVAKAELSLEELGIPRYDDLYTQVALERDA